MNKKFSCHTRPPERKELSNNPVKMCNEIAHIFRGYLRVSHENDDIMSAHGTRLVISFLAVEDGVTQLDLVNATHMRAPTISVILKKLEEEGIVRREKDKKDLRVFRVYLTDKGREIDKNNIERIKAADAMALEGLDETEKEELMKLLSKIRDNLLEANSCPKVMRSEKEGISE